MNQYETVFILTPVLSDEQMKETVEKFRNLPTPSTRRQQDSTSSLSSMQLLRLLRLSRLSTVATKRCSAISQLRWRSTQPSTQPREEVTNKLKSRRHKHGTAIRNPLLDSSRY